MSMVTQVLSGRDKMSFVGQGWQSKCSEQHCVAMSSYLYKGPQFSTLLVASKQRAVSITEVDIRAG